MKTFEIRQDVDGTREYLFDVEAESIREAASAASRKLNHPGRSHAQRLTGDPGKSGMFQGYRNMGNGEASVGSPFHVCEA